ncbi:MULTISPECIES: VOC family protein [Streptomyces]|uniref:Glyoxalase/bleomycin resistance/extradiol dioxygenase family protein n=1 Tax=Streptomyces tsukubensis (strain DSM 42081 / NBRC 108919 / NRRL 18488 / 9993) TaxID=1114943 RepID=I2MT65_STRT9|nr:MULTISPECIES: VOC family protein [Streptomyces]AZK92560.1 glyoxalase/bleomycin resistance/extradiol dioxygenase family protein [Streptomyces tsukubensis]EIF87962.1 glyoxalase family protein [Streptomyces tsukubensis NRRL18488]MYS65920.1 glyoxalase/bleomycin resistance/extradiol dioxygenase family protein [Streptomyces sp. SID5473]QKM71260.1 glyoxalase/bleomycin resistance/extradiol dioxygenase family protein [Streptomyces tsukubensis NRRL18488]TAI40427.1 glyoxalase/bleomycin resistance/extr
MTGKLSGFYPVIGTRDIAAARDFYTARLGFEVTFEADWYVSLRRPDAPHYELALLDPAHPTVPEGHRTPLTGGLLLNFEVEDVDAEHRRLVDEAGLTELLTLRTEEFGQRHFIVEGPDGVLIDIITVVPPTGAYAEQYAEGHVPQ